MNILQKVSLKQYSTMRLGGIAQFLSEVNNKQELTEAVEWAKSERLQILMVGGGSNIIWQDEGFSGLLLVNCIKGFSLDNDDPENLYITIGAGENWDSVVERVVDLGYSGIESLSLIPGKVGATPVQNVGAYGQEISSCLVSLEAYDLESGEFVVIDNKDCGFGYRTSRFKTIDAHRYLIVAITLRFNKKLPEAPFYPEVQKYIDEHQLSEITPQTIREAVIQIRQAKLPDPAIVANCGSFFTNPVIENKHLTELQKKYPAIPYWQIEDNKVKLSAAWLMNEAGFKAVNDPQTGISTWPTQTLVLINTSAKTTADLITYKHKITREVSRLFKVTLVQEPELLP